MHISEIRGRMVPPNTDWTRVFLGPTWAQRRQTDMELIDALKKGDIKGVASRLKFAWAEAALLITVACGGTGVITGQNQPAGAEGQGGQPAATEPGLDSRLITPDNAQGNSQLLSQLDVVRRQSGRPNCIPQLLQVDGINTSITDGYCQVGGATYLVTRKEEGQSQQVLNQELRAFPQVDGKGNISEIVFASQDGTRVLHYDALTGNSEYFFSSGLKIEFGKGSSPLEDQITRILADRAGVAAAAQSTATLELPGFVPVTLTPTGIVVPPTATREPTVEPTETLSEAERLGIPVGESTWDLSAQRAAIEKYFLSKYPGKTWEDIPEVLDLALDESPARTGARRGTFSGGAGYLDPEYNGPDGNVVDAQYLGSYRFSLEGRALGDGTVGKKGDWFVNALYAIPRNGFNTEIDGLIFKNVDIMPVAVSAEVNGKFVVVMLAHGRTDSLPSSLGSLTNALKWMDDGENPNAPHLVEVSTRFVSRDKIAGYISGGVLFITDSYLGNNSEGDYYPGIWDVLDQVRSNPDGVGKFGVFVIVNQVWPVGSY